MKKCGNKSVKLVIAVCVMLLAAGCGKSGAVQTASEKEVEEKENAGTALPEEESKEAEVPTPEPTDVPEQVKTLSKKVELESVSVDVSEDEYEYILNENGAGNSGNRNVFGFNLPEDFKNHGEGIITGYYRFGPSDSGDSIAIGHATDMGLRNYMMLEGHEPGEKIKWAISYLDFVSLEQVDEAETLYGKTQILLLTTELHNEVYDGPFVMEIAFFRVNNYDIAVSYTYVTSSNNLVESTYQGKLVKIFPELFAPASTIQSEE